MSNRFYPAPVGLWRRDRRCTERYDYEPHFIRYHARPGNPVYLDDLAIEPREIQTQLPELINPAARERLRSRVIGMGRVVDKIPFGKAMRKLHKEVGKAEVFYREFQEDFERETASIKKYATADACYDLWMMKTGRWPKDQRDSEDTQDGYNDDEQQTPERTFQRFNEWQNKISLAMQTAINARLGDGVFHTRKIENRLDSKRRLQRKVEVSSEQIVELLRKAAVDQEHCISLLSELEAFKILIDPEEERNKEVYRDCKDDDDEGDCDD